MHLAFAKCHKHQNQNLPHLSQIYFFYFKRNDKKSFGPNFTLRGMADCVMVAMNGPKVDPETGVKIEAGVLDAERVEVSAERYSVDD